jgi:hypothetical protein
MISKVSEDSARKFILEDKEAKDVLLMTMRVKVLEFSTKTFLEVDENFVLRDLVGEALTLAANDWKVMSRIAEKVDKAE